MAGYSENREQNLEMKYLRKELFAVDSRIKTPESLNGYAMLRKLDGVEQRIPLEKKVKELIFPRRPNLGSWLTYAVAFTLAVGLFYGLGFHNHGNVTVGEIALPQNNGQLPPLDQGGGISVAGADQHIDGVSAIAQETEVSQAPWEAHISDHEALPGLYNIPEPFGGPGSVTRLGQFGEFVLSYRPNDATDPDHLSEAPKILLLFDADENNIISQIDIPYMTEIAAFYVNGSILALVGATEDKTYVYTIDYTFAENPVSFLLLDQPGALTAYNYFDGFLYVASHTTEIIQETESSIVLENSAEQGASVLTLINIMENTVNQIYVIGAGGEVQLNRTGARIFYMAYGEESQPGQEWVARVDIVIGALQMIFAGAEPV